MAGRGERAGRRGRGGLLFAGVFAVIALAWAVTTFSGSVAGAYDGAMNRMFSPSDEELRAATSDYFDALAYQGSDSEEFISDVDATVVEDRYYESPAGKFDKQNVVSTLDEVDVTLQYTEEIRNFEVQSRTREEATTTVEYEENFKAAGELEGSSVLRTEVRLAETDGGWKVGWADRPEVIEDNSPPDENSEDANNTTGSEDG